MKFILLNYEMYGSHMDGCKTEELEAVAGNLETDGFYCLPPSQIRDGLKTERHRLSHEAKYK